MAESDISLLLTGLNIDDQHWTEKQREDIKAWKKYGADLMVYCEELLENGYSLNSEPKKPTVSLGSLVNGKKTKSTTLLVGDKLHAYLLQHIIKDKPVTFDASGTFKSLCDIQHHLKCGFEFVKQQNSSTLCASIDYGYWLNIAFDLHTREKIAGNIKGTWKEWLETNVGIQDSYARKLRAVATLLQDYPRFRQLGLTFSEVYQHRKQIQEMLQGDCGVAEYWSYAS